MKEIILALGISGSGKTYWSKQWAEEDPEHRIRLNYDDIRCMFGKYWVPDKREQLVKDMFNYAVKQAMYMGYDIVIDNMSNLNPKHQKEYEKLVKEHNDFSATPNSYKLTCKLFDTPVEVCIERDSKRIIPIGEKVIRQQWKQYRTQIIQRSIQEMLSKQKKQDSSLPHCIIVDMDATLCFNTQGREFWGKGVNEKLINDYPNYPVIQIVQSYKAAPYGTNYDTYEKNHNVFIITGRDESCRTGTEAWLKKYNVPYDKLLMRPIGDFTKGEELKQILYENEVKDEYYVDFVLEDSSKVVKMYRDLGLTVLQPNEGKF